MADTSTLAAPGDIATATGLLTRLPLPMGAGRGAAAAWAYPVAGLIVGVIAALTGAIGLAFGLPPALVAGLVLFAGILVTGALHEDGWADTADGLWGGWDRVRRLDIMKDSRIGPYGVIALILGLGLKWQALSVAIAGGWLWPAVLASAMLSRACMVATMYALPHARDGGLSRATGRPRRATMLLALVLGGLGSLLLGWAAIPALICAGGATLALGLVARAKIGGQTGDILGATQFAAEIAILAVVAAKLG